MSDIKTALLIDGGWFRKVLGKNLPVPLDWPTAQQVYENALLALAPGERLMRMFYYDAEPYDRIVINPVDGSEIDFTKSRGYGARKKFFSDLMAMDYVALRRGELRNSGWQIKEEYFQRLMAFPEGTPLTSYDIEMNFIQKGVDMRLGIDIATLALKKQVERIILLTADTDIIPAMKLARREGIQIVLVNVGRWVLIDRLIEECDILRTLQPK